MDYFYPVRVLETVLKRLSFPIARVLFHDPHKDRDILFAQGGSLPSGTLPGREITVPFGSLHRMTAVAPSGMDKTLSFLGSSLGNRMDASRSEILLRPLPPSLPLQAVAESASRHFADSQAPFATLCILDTVPFQESLCSVFPLMNPECLHMDVLKLLSFLFEAAGSLYVSDEGPIVGLVCAQSPTDVELLQLQLTKSLRRILSFPPAPSLPILRSRLFESPSRDAVLRFCQEERTAADS